MSAGLTTNEILNLSLVGVRDLIAQGAVSSVEVVEAAIAQAERFDKSHNLFITFAPELALAQARDIDARRAAGQPIGLLGGVPITVKDNVDVAGLPGTAATLVLKDRVPTEDATVVANLKNAGVVILGKVNMHEMAMGGTSINPITGTVGNPWDLTRIAGGSSGASASCVALRIGYASLGTDAGGSVRIPSCCCGIVGLKQTHGVVSLAGGLPTTTQHVDHIGPHTRTVGDAKLMLEVMASYDELDVHSTPHVLAAADDMADLSGLTIGLPEAYFWTDLDAEVESACREAVTMLRELGADIRPIDLDISEDMPLLQSAMMAEAYVYHQPILEAHGDLYSDDLRYRILAGQYVLAQDYIRSMRARRRLIEKVRDVMGSVDLLAMPTLPVPALELSAIDGWASSRILVRNTSPFNQTGLPAITLPVAVTNAGTPIGFQLVAGAFDDYRLIAAAEVLERELKFDPTPPVLREPATV